jgi:prepilin-type processing-associated H-X9-DG protein
VRGCGNSTNGFGTGKYISTPAILFCPSTTNLGNGSGVWAVTPTLGNFQTNFENTSAATLTWGSYTVNCDNNNATYTSNADGPYGSGGGTLTRCNTLSGNIANGTAVKRFACAADAFATGSTLGTTNGAAGIYYHQGGGLSLLGCNVLYFDGSVQWWSNNNNILLNTGCPTYGNTKSLGTNTFWTLVENGVAGTKFTGPY